MVNIFQPQFFFLSTGYTFLTVTIQYSFYDYFYPSFLSSDFFQVVCMLHILFHLRYIILKLIFYLLGFFFYCCSQKNDGQVLVKFRLPLLSLTVIWTFFLLLFWIFYPLLLSCFSICFVLQLLVIRGFLYSKRLRSLIQLQVFLSDCGPILFFLIRLGLHSFYYIYGIVIQTWAQY